MAILSVGRSLLRRRGESLGETILCVCFELFEREYARRHEFSVVYGGNAVARWPSVLEIGGRDQAVTEVEVVFHLCSPCEGDSEKPDE